ARAGPAPRARGCAAQGAADGRSTTARGRGRRAPGGAAVAGVARAPRGAWASSRAKIRAQTHACRWRPSRATSTPSPWNLPGRLTIALAPIATHTHMNDLTRAPRVLVVESDEEIAQALQRSLGMEGYEVRSADDGRAALEHRRTFAKELGMLD